MVRAPRSLTRHLKVPGFFFDGAMPVPTLNIIVNDARQTVPAGTNVESLLELLGVQPRFLAVELNRRVVPRGDHRQTLLAEGDQIEIVTLVGGG